MKTTILTLICLLSFFIPVMQSQVIHVPSDQPAIQAAIDMAFDHDTVLVDPGEYFENIDFKGKNIVICSQFAVTGDDTYIISTIINGSSPLYPDTGSCVRIVSGEDSTAVLQGFTITGGTGTRWEDEHNLNHWYTEGGGIIIQYASPTIKNNFIKANEAINKPAGTTSAGGGAIRCGDGNPHILNNIITNNQGRYGGGIVMNYSGAVIKNNIIADNSGGQDYGGGGLWFLSNGAKPLIVENNTIVNNTSSLGGGGIRLWSSAATLTNNIIWGNTANTAPQIQGTTGQVSYSCIEGGFAGENNIDSDPTFINGTYVLSDNSPCIDTGNPDEAYNDPEDSGNPGFALFPAKGTLTSDMGAFGGPGSETLPGMITGLREKQEKPISFIANIYPNPASNKLTIKLESTQPTWVSIQICDSGARMVRNLGNAISVVGVKEICSDISQLKQGIYWVRIFTTNENFVNRFVKY